MHQPTILFRNSGELDIRLMATFGCSVKESDNPIGFFGTGLKYALAVLLRTGHKVVFHLGTEVLHAETKEMILRGKSFQGIFVGDTYLGFTTELGKNWELWMAYRELYCNAKDEPECEVREIFANDPLTPLPNKTSIIIIGDDFAKEHRQRGQFLLESNPDFVLGNTVEVRTTPSNGLFYKGVRVATLDAQCLFTYNIIAPLTLTEDRTCASMWDARREIALALSTHAPELLLMRILSAPIDNYEHSLDFDWHSSTPSDTFCNVVTALERDSAMTMNRSAYTLFARTAGKKGISPREVVLSPVEQKTLEKAIVFCERVGFPLRHEYPILVAESLGTNVLALAERTTKRIFLTRQVFNDGGTKGVTSALIEEYLHLKHNLNDLSRPMQTHLFNKIVSLGEELQGEPL